MPTAFGEAFILTYQSGIVAVIPVAVMTYGIVLESLAILSNVSG